MEQYEDASFQCTGSEAALTDCPETGELNCVADSAAHALAVSCGDDGGGIDGGGIDGGGIDGGGIDRGGNDRGGIDGGGNDGGPEVMTEEII